MITGEKIVHAGSVRSSDSGTSQRPPLGTCAEHALKTLYGLNERLNQIRNALEQRPDENVGAEATTGLGSTIRTIESLAESAAGTANEIAAIIGGIGEARLR